MIGSHVRSHGSCTTANGYFINFNLCLLCTKAFRGLLAYILQSLPVHTYCVYHYTNYVTYDSVTTTSSHNDDDNNSNDNDDYMDFMAVINLAGYLKEEKLKTI